MRSVRLRPVPRRVLLQGPGEAADLSVGQGAARSTRSSPTTTRSGTRTGRTRRPARRCSRRSTRSSSCGTRASTRAPASPAPTATCRTSASGALKISDHHVRSPLLNINRACQTCHKWPEEELQGARRDDPGAHLRAAQPGDGRAGRADRRHQGGAAAGRPTSALAAAARTRSARRSSCLDFVEAENSMGFHAPQESVRILAESIDLARQGQIALRAVKR